MVANSEYNPIASGQGPGSEEDGEDNFSVVRAVRQYKTESEDARRSRVVTADRNWDAYLGKQDWSHKQEGQSTEFLPKVPVSVEQLAALVKRGMVQFGNYYSIDVDAELQDKIDGTQLRSFLNLFLNDLWTPGPASGQLTMFAQVVSDSVKQALLKNLIIWKVHGGNVRQRKFVFERGDQGVPSLKTKLENKWKLRIDLVRMEDYYPDPTGNGLYEIHRVERDFHQVYKMAEEGIYDMAVVRQIIGIDQDRPEDEKLQEEDRNQDETTNPSFRKRVVIDEFWGTLLDENGLIKHENVVCAVANDRFLIRKPEPNPFWHQESPFIAAPLIRVPHSVWHKALYDHASDLNLAINEMFNLILDGGLASVWGIKQVRVEDLDDPSQIEGGIRQGMTLAVKQTLPHNAKVLETVSEGDVPNEAMAVFEFLNREFTSAAMTNELKLGSLPPKQVLATEVLESSQSQNLMLDGIVTDLENAAMAPALRKAFLVILQNADEIDESTVKSSSDREALSLIMKAEPEERFALFANKCQFRVNGLSSTMTRALDFQKIMALLQATSTNPALFAAFMRKFSPERALRRLMVALNINSEDLEKSPEELQNAGQEMADVIGATALLGQGPKNAEGQAAGVAGGPGTGGDPTTAGIQQQANPATGLPPNIGAS